MIEAVVRDEVRRWIERESQGSRTASSLWDEVVTFMESATPQETSELAARIVGFAAAITRKQEETHGTDRNGS